MKMLATVIFLKILIAPQAFAEKCENKDKWTVYKRSDGSLYAERCSSFGTVNGHLSCTHTGARPVLSKDSKTAWCAFENGDISLSKSEKSVQPQCERTNDNFWSYGYSGEDGSRIAIRCRFGRWADSAHHIIKCQKGSTPVITKDATAAWCQTKDGHIGISTDPMFANNYCHRNMSDTWHLGIDVNERKVAIQCRHGRFESKFYCDNGEVQ
jgi:hypothetical protein